MRRQREGEGVRRGGGQMRIYICGGQRGETRQVAVTLKMTVIKVTVAKMDLVILAC